MAVGTAQFQHELNLQVTLYPIKNFRFDKSTIPLTGVRFGEKFETCQLQALAVENVGKETPSALASALGKLELGMPSPRSYLPIAAR